MQTVVNDPSTKTMSIFMKNNLQNLQRLHAQKNIMSSQTLNYNDSRDKFHVSGQPPVTLARLIAKRNWNDVENILSSSSGSSVEWTEIDEKGLITEDNILHLACRFRAPLHIVKLLAARYNGSLRKPDPTGRFAIHLAAKYSATPDVMQFLIRANEAAAGIQDDIGKTPIHYVGEFYVRHHDPSVSISEVNDNMLQVVRLLKSASPMSFNLEDDEGCNAIELALESDTDIKIVKSMQRAARDDWRDLKATKGLKHEDLAKGLERAASEVRMKVCNDAILCESSFGERRRPRNVVENDVIKKSFVAKSA